MRRSPTTTRPSYRPTLTTFIISDSTITGAFRIWFVLTSATLSVQPATGPAGSSINFVGIAVETGVSSAWRCCSGDGANYTCDDITGTSLAASTEYKLTLDYSVAGRLRCGVQAGAGSPSFLDKTTNLPTAAVDLGTQNTISPLDGASKNHYIARTVLEQN